MTLELCALRINNSGMFKLLPPPLHLLRYAGIFTWFSVGVILTLRWSPFRSQALDLRTQLLWLCFLVFGASFYWLTTRGARARGFKVDLALAALTLSAVLVGLYTRSGLGSTLLIISAGLLPWLLNTRAAVAWLIGQNLAMIPVFNSISGYSLLDAAFQAALILGCSSFVFMISLTALKQTQARDAMRKINAELRATQSLLAESERVSERLRISRELHDLVGHHLTALSLNLEVASHLIEGKAKEHVLKAQSLSKLLLSDVREVVSSLRESDAINLGLAIKELMEGVPNLKVNLDMPEPFECGDPARAQVVLRLAQEVLTNTLKHARAQQLWLTFRVQQGRIEIAARDDGRGSDQIKAGNGLAGMRERLAQFGGVLEVQSAPGKGFELAAELPMETFA